MLSVKEKISLLKGIRLFDNALPGDLKKIADVAHEVSFSDEDKIIVEGDKGDSLYFVVDGKVKVLKSGTELFQLGPKECIGEMAMIDDQPRSASIISIGNTTLLKISRDDFQNIVCVNSRLLRSFMKVVVGKLRTGTDREDNTMKEAVRAGEIQMSILPKPNLQFLTNGKPTLEISSIYSPHPSERVSGDYYDYFTLSDHQIGIVIGDVMGHGIHAGMIVCMAKGCVHGRIKTDFSIPGIMSTMNDMVYKFINTNLSDQGSLNPPYMTFCYLIFDLQNCTVSFSNAGHNAAPYHYRANTGQIHSLKTHTLPLGLLDGVEYEVSKFKWGMGDILVLYTDGIVDAEDKKGKPYGSEKLKALIKQNSNLSAEGIRDTIIDEINRYCHGSYGDDRSLIIVK